MEINNLDEDVLSSCYQHDVAYDDIQKFIQNQSGIDIAYNSKPPDSFNGCFVINIGTLFTMVASMTQ